MNVEKSAGIIFFRRENNKILYLLLRASRIKNENKKPEFWDFPKGLLENNEKGIDAALREAREETGITELKIIPDFKETVKYFTKRGGRTALKFVTMFLAESLTDKVSLSWEHDKYKWLVYEEAREKITRTEMKKILEKAERYS